MNKTSKMLDHANFFDHYIDGLDEKITEHQRQALFTLKGALSRCEQEGIEISLWLISGNLHAVASIRQSDASSK